MIIWMCFIDTRISTFVNVEKTPRVYTLGVRVWHREFSWKLLFASCVWFFDRVWQGVWITCIGCCRTGKRARCVDVISFGLLRYIPDCWARFFSSIWEIVLASRRPIKNNKQQVASCRPPVRVPLVYSRSCARRGKLMTNEWALPLLLCSLSVVAVSRRSHSHSVGGDIPPSVLSHYSFKCTKGLCLWVTGIPGTVSALS